MKDDGGMSQGPTPRLCDTTAPKPNTQILVIQLKQYHNQEPLPRIHSQSNKQFFKPTTMHHRFHHKLHTKIRQTYQHDMQTATTTAELAAVNIFATSNTGSELIQNSPQNPASFPQNALDDRPESLAATHPTDFTMADDEKKADDRIDYLRGRILGAFKHLKADRIEKGFNAPESMCVRWVARAARCWADVRWDVVLGPFLLIPGVPCAVVARI